MANEINTVVVFNKGARKFSVMAFKDGSFQRTVLDPGETLEIEAADYEKIKGYSDIYDASAMKADAGTVSIANEKLQQANEELESENTDLKGKIEELQNKVLTLESQGDEGLVKLNQELTGERDRLEGENKKLEDKNKKLEEKVDTLKDELKKERKK